MIALEQGNTSAATGAQPGAAALVNPDQSTHFHLAYKRLKPKLTAIPIERAVRIVFDVGLVVQTTLGVLPELEKLRPEIEQECPRLSTTLIPDLREAAYALAHLEALRRGSKGQPLGATVNDAVTRIRSARDVLLADVQPLVARGLLDEKALLLTPGNSPRNIAFDVLRLVNYLDENWATLAGKTLTTEQDLDAARVQARDLITSLGVRDNAESEEELSVTRQRAMTLLMDIYEELRWAVRYTRRRAEDGDLIMPSLYSLRSRRSGGSEQTDEDETPPAVGGVNAPRAGEAGAGAVDAAHLEAVMAGNWPVAGNPAAPAAQPPAVTAPKAAS
jgi:hypothetical protein